MKYTLLGSGAVWPSEKYAGPSQLLDVGEESPLLFDCGRGFSHRVVQAGYQIDKIRNVFFTHHHFDHNSEYAYFLLLTWVMGRNDPLNVYGPEGTKRLNDATIDTIYIEDISSRLSMRDIYRGNKVLTYDESPPRTRDGLKTKVTELTQAGMVLENSNWKMSCGFTDHISAYIKSLAYRIDSHGRSIVIAGDSRPTPNIVTLAKGADVLVHECTGPEEFLEKRGYAMWHSGPTQLGKVAQEAGVKKLVMKHFHQEFIDEKHLQEMAAHAREVFDGEVIIGRELFNLEI